MTDVRRPRAPSCVKCARPDHSRPRRRSNKLGGCGRAKKLLAGAGGADHADTARPAAADGSRPPGPSSPRVSSGGAAAARSADQRQPQLSPVSRTCTSASLSSLCAANAPPFLTLLRSGPADRVVEPPHGAGRWARIFPPSRRGVGPTAAGGRCSARLGHLGAGWTELGSAPVLGSAAALRPVHGGGRPRPPAHGEFRRWVWAARCAAWPLRHSTAVSSTLAEPPLRATAERPLRVTGMDGRPSHGPVHRQPCSETNGPDLSRTNSAGGADAV